VGKEELSGKVNRVVTDISLSVMSFQVIQRGGAALRGNVEG